VNINFFAGIFSAQYFDYFVFLGNNYFLKINIIYTINISAFFAQKDWGKDFFDQQMLHKVCPRGCRW